MIIVYGTRFYGKVKACGSSFLGTQFVHIWYVPLIPVGTHLVLGESGNGNFRSIKTEFSFKSMMAGYLRVWGPIGVLAAIGLTLSALEEVGDDTLAMAVTGAFSGL